MMLLLDVTRKLQGQLMVLSEQDLMKVVDIVFILCRHLFLLQLMKEAVLMRVEEVRILCYLVVGMLYLVHQVLMVVVSFQIHQ